MNIILCGLPMSGKSTIGSYLAARLGVPFIETDQMIEVACGEALSCRQICQQKGEPYFRSLEREQISSLAGIKGVVVSLGGGSLVDEANTQQILKLGTLVYLKTDPELLWNRTAVCGIPSYLNSSNPRQSFMVMAQERMAIFEAAANLIVDVHHGNIEGIINQIIGKANHGK